MPANSTAAAGLSMGRSPPLLANERKSMDIYDGTEWTEMDIKDLKSEIESGRSIKEAAEFLCRAHSIEDVILKCRELGLKPPFPIPCRS